MPESTHPAPQRKVQFIHIPKCAGNSVYFGLKQALGNVHGEMLDVGKTIAAARQVKWGLPWPQWEEHYLECRAYLLQYALHRGVPLIGGHYPFSPVARFWFQKEYAFVTVLREPVERLTSNLIWLTFADGRRPLADFESGQASPEEELDFLLQHEMTPWIARTLTLYLGGINAEGRGQLEGATKRAIQHLDLLDAIGFAHDLPAFAQKCEKLFKHPFPLERRNATAQFLQNRDLQKRIQTFFNHPPRRQHLTTLSQDDLTLYDHAAGSQTHQLTQ